MPHHTHRTFAFLLTLLITAGVQASPPDTTEDPDTPENTPAILTHIAQAQATATTQVVNLVDNALLFLGVPYRPGGSRADIGFDCSGFVKAVYAQTLGVILPRRAAQQANTTLRIDASDLQPGDLVFFNTMRRAFSHVGIYIGDGQFVHSPRPGERVRIDRMDLSYWKRRFDGARRVLFVENPPAE